MVASAVTNCVRSGIGESNAKEVRFDVRVRMSAMYALISLIPPSPSWHSSFMSFLICDLVTMGIPVSGSRISVSIRGQSLSMRLIWLSSQPAVSVRDLVHFASLGRLAAEWREARR